LWVVLVGVALGILFMRFAAGIFSYAVQREPVLNQAAYLLVLAIGIELLISEVTGAEIADWLRFCISLGIILLSLAYSHLKFLHVLQPVIFWVARGFSKINNLLDWALEPIFWLFGLIKTLIMKLFTRPEHAPAE